VAVLLASMALAIVAGSALAASGNLVKNGSFEKDNDHDGIPNGWTGVNLTLADKRVCNQSKAGSCSFKAVGDGTDKVLIQDIAASGLANDQLTLSAWTKGKNIVLGAGVSRLVFRFNYTDFTDEYVNFNIPAGTTAWTLRQQPLQATKDFASISIFIPELSADSGKLWVDKVSLVRVP
jgi:hypothetical protein